MTLHPPKLGAALAATAFSLALAGAWSSSAGTRVLAQSPAASLPLSGIWTVDPMHTNVKMRDDDLRSDHYFDAAKYPQITFQSTPIGKGKHGAFIADGNGQTLANGDFAVGNDIGIVISLETVPAKTVIKD